MINFNQLDTYGRVSYIFQHFQTLIGLIGIIGNILVLLVLSRKRLRKYSYSFYLKMLALSDIVLLGHSFRHWAQNILDADIDKVDEFFCRIGEFQPYSASLASLWLLCLISFDRLITIVYPQQFKFLKRRSVQIALVLLVFIYSMLANILLAIYYRLVDLTPDSTNSSENTRIKICMAPENVLNIQLWIYFVNAVVVTIILNNVLNLIIIRYVFASRRNLKSLSSRDRKFAVTSIGLNVCCLICKLPLMLGKLVLSYQGVTLEQFQMWFTIFVAIATIDNADAFFVNMIVNSSFYDEFMRMVKLKKEKKIERSTLNQQKTN